jgi:ribosomal protein S27AE
MANPMTCPICGTTMNHHAEKLVDPRDEEDAEAMDPRLGGLIEEVHTCPECGRETSRRGA